MPVIGIGIDLVEVARVERMLATRGERMLARLFTAAEIEYAMARSAPAPHLAVRIAAKEAGFKALAGTEEARGIGWKELEVHSGWGGIPELRLHGRALSRSTQLSVTRVHLSLTHSHSAAAAVVIIEGE